MTTSEVMPTTGEDSAGRPIKVGDRVKFRGQIYTIEGFKPGEGRFGCQGIIFEREPHIPEAPDEISVDVVVP